MYLFREREKLDHMVMKAKSPVICHLLCELEKQESQGIIQSKFKDPQNRNFDVQGEKERKFTLQPFCSIWALK